MSSLGPRPVENGESGRHHLSGEATAMARRHSMPFELAALVVNEPAHWMQRLANYEDAQEVTTAAVSQIKHYEERYGVSRDWDMMRIYLGGALIVQSRANSDMAAEVLVGASDVHLMMKEIGDFLAHAVASDSMDHLEMRAIIAKVTDGLVGIHGEEWMQQTFADFVDAHSNSVMVSSVFGAEWQTEAVIKTPPEPEITTIAAARERCTIPPWDTLEALIEWEEVWPEDTAIEERTDIILQFGRLMHEAFSPPNVERKAAEGVKLFIKQRQSGRAGDVWDDLRFIVISGLYSRDEHTLGRTLTRNMDKPQMMAFVAQFLLESGSDAHAMDILNDFPDTNLYGEMLAIGEWSDRAAIDALIEDITIVTPKTTRKHEPKRQLGAAQGLHKVFAARAVKDPAWEERAEIMRKRAALLERQIRIGYIKSNRKK